MSSSTFGIRTGTNARLGVLARVLPAALLATLAGAPVGFAQVQPDIRNPLNTPDTVPGIGDGVKVDENLVVDLHVNDEDLSNVLQMLSIQSQRNIVSSKNVSATVTANLYSVTFYEALDAILHVNGYGYIEEGNFIYVYTFEELETIVQESRQRAWKVIKLNYLNAVDAAEFVKPLLSEGGQIKTNGVMEAFPNATLPVGADQFANEATMVVSDYPEIIEEIERLLAELDTRPAQILIEATILQSQLTEANAFGVDFSIIGSMDWFDFAGSGGPLSIVNGLIGGSSSQLDTSGGSQEVPAPNGDEGSGIVSNPGNTSGPATFKAGIVNGDVAAFVRLLDEVSDTTILSRPNILTLNRQPARVLVGKKVGYLNTTSTDTATTQSVEFLDTGTQLYVRPFVSTEGTIRMELKPQVSEASIRDATDATGAIVTIPDELTNELIANVMVRDGQTVVLGGLFRDNTSLSRRQVPFAGDIPIIGMAFRGHDDSVDRSEIIFMIKPTIVSDDVLIEQGHRSTGIIERAVAGTREGLLPWSAKKRSHQHLVAATRLVEEGKYNQALHKIRQALSLQHSQAEAITMRDKIRGEMTGDADIYMEEIISGELEQMLEENVSPEDQRSGAGNRPKDWIYVPQQDEFTYEWQNQNEQAPAKQPTNDLANAEENGPLSQNSRRNTLPARERTTPARVDDQSAGLARSNREQPAPLAANQPTDWKALQNEIRAEANRSTPTTQPAPQPVARTAPAVASQTPNATSTDAAPQEGQEGYRYTESEDAVLEMLDGVVGLNTAVAAGNQPAMAVSQPGNDEETVTLNVNGAKASTAIQMVSNATGHPAVVAPGVDAKVSVALNDATFQEAMLAITTRAGLNALDYNGVTYVYKTHQVDPNATNAPNWVWKAVELDHVDAGKLLANARKVISSDGQAETDQNIPFDAPFNAGELQGRSAIVVFDLLPNAEQLAWILKDIDSREGQRVANVGTGSN
jgi:type II secretory pathway component GspD/PulD (secretin)